MPEDPEIVDAYVHELLYTSRLIHGRHPDTREPFANVGEDLETTIGKTDVSFALSHVAHCYHFAAGVKPVYKVRELHPVVKEFKKFIETEGVVYAAFNKMFKQAPKPKND